ncbi:MAG: transglycosylase domain-containing protein [Nocardioides sp.]
MSATPRAPSPAEDPGKDEGEDPGEDQGKRRRPHRAKRIIGRVLIGTLLLGLIGTLTGLGAFAYLYQKTEIPDRNKDFETQTTRIFYSNGKELGSFAIQNRESISFEEMPQCIKDGVVAAENRTFWTDKGIDPRGIVRAAFNNAQGGPKQGASTITQQYVKILYLTQERTLERKLDEALVSLKLQREKSKEQILHGYLNTIYFGRGAYGIQAAAKTFFDKPAARLNLRQCAALASILNNPSGFDPANGEDNKARLTERYEYVLDGMVDMKTIDSAEGDQAKLKLPKFPKLRSESQYGGQKGHMLRLVREELLQMGYRDEEIDGGGLKVTTTFTPGAMAAAREGVEAQRPSSEPGKRFGKNLHVGVASVEPGTGALRGFYGGHDFLDSEINWASAGGQVGSTMKPFVIAAALNEGYSLKDSFAGNSPFPIPPANTVEIRNEGDTDYGERISMTRATQESVNTAFIDMTLAMDQGPEKVIETATAMGVPSDRGGAFGIPRKSRGLEPVASVGLGSAVASPINMANAYATLANGGKAAKVHVIERVVDRDGEKRRYKVSSRQAISPEIAADTSYALQQVVDGGTGQAARSLSPYRPAAGKTGTATNAADEVSSAWFVGYTPQMATAVMYVRGKGNERLEGWLPEYFGGAYPARTWTDVMNRLLEGQDVESFPPPANLDGEAPQTGHEPYVPPPPKPTKKPKPPRGPGKPTGRPTDTASPTDPPTGTASPTDPPTGSPSVTDTASVLP